MKPTFISLLVLLTTALPAVQAEAQNTPKATRQPMTKQERKEHESLDMLRLLDKAAGLDTLYTDTKLQVRNLYTDSLQVGISLNNGHQDVLTWFDAKQIEYFRYRTEYYEKRTLVENDGRERYIHLKRDKGSNRQRTMVYSMGKGAQAQYYVRYKESPQLLVPMAGADGHYAERTMQYLDSLWETPTRQASDYVAQTKPSRHDFRQAERIYRTHNDHYLTRFRWGVAAGLNHTQATATTGDFDPQLCATGGLWADLPIDYTGFSLRVEAYYTALSGRCETPDDEAVYNYKGLEFPLLVRYTALPLHGRLLPYAEAGIALDQALKHNLYLETVHRDGQHTYYKQMAGDPVSKLATTIVVGAGAEFILSPRHSVWAGLRYRQDSRLDAFMVKSLENTYNSDNHFNVDRSGLLFTLMFNL